MNMVGHHHETPKLIMSECRSPMQRLYHQAGDSLLAREPSPPASRVQLMVQPDESLAGRGFAGWWEVVWTNAPVKVPGKKQPAILWIQVRKAAHGAHMQLVESSREKSRLRNAGVDTSVDAARKSACATAAPDTDL